MSKAHTRVLAAALAAVALFGAGGASAAAQVPAKPAEAPASVSGRVTDGEKGLPGIIVAVFVNDPQRRNQPVTRTRTDAEGAYHLTGLQPGRYHIAPSAPAHIVREMPDFQMGRPLDLSPGDSVDGIDFRLDPGGVITGKVTDPDGNPLVGEFVVITNADPSAPPRPVVRMPFDPRDMQTDDRGVYRVYGLQPGRYYVSVGQEENTGGVRPRRPFRRTFHPEATEQAQARVVEVRAGGEAEDVDIKLSKRLQTFKVSGRFVSAETGKPVAGVSFSVGVIVTTRGRPGVGRTYMDGSQSDERGEFQTAGLTAGTYTVLTANEGNSDYYAEPTQFEVTDADVSGVVVRLRQGASVSGVVQFEGAVDRETAARVYRGMLIYGNLELRGKQPVSPMPSYVRPQPVGPDGTFTVRGLAPGRLRLSVAGGPAAAGSRGGVSLTRIEVGGVPVQESIEVREGAQLAGVRLLLAYGSGVVRGQLQVTGGTLSPGSRVMASARRLSPAGEVMERTQRGAEVDARGRFVIEGLAPGEYEIRVNTFGGQGRSHSSEPQRVSVADGAEHQVTITMNLTPTPPQGNRP
jgi:protocatechuate 3,4-dioxygenase beta subunit